MKRPTTRRDVLLSAAAAAAACALPPAAEAQGPPSDADIEELIKGLNDGRAAWINGQLEWTATSAFEQDPQMTIFGPFGGEAGRGPEMQSRQQANVAAFRGGTGDCEVVSIMREGDLAVIVMVERNSVMFEGRTEPHPWVVRTTQVFRRDRPGHWLRLHRHADPLIRRRTLTDTLALLENAEAAV